ncbi:MAG: MoxR family ATPase [Treponemataceae bacterium]
MEQDRIKETNALLGACRTELAKRVVGQSGMVDGLLIALIAGGHALLEGVPGLAKTLAVKTLSELTGLSFKRIQFTPDLLPADLTGTLIWEQAKGTFSVRKGPIFANVILADEINRAPAKVQSALLEAMEERQVTIGEESLKLPDPFFVLATQNPIEHEGTYALPEAELDRFLVKLLIPYPSREEESRIVRLVAAESPTPIKPILDEKTLRKLSAAAESVTVDERVVEYIVSLVAATRPAEDHRKSHRDDLYRYISFGASPRASISLFRCARVRALFEGRAYVIPEDIKEMAPAVLRHRVVLSYEAEADGLNADDVVARVLGFVPVP